MSFCRVDSTMGSFTCSFSFCPKSSGHTGDKWEGSRCFGSISPQVRLFLEARARTAQQRVPHLSELLTSLLAGRVALNPSDAPNPGISQKGVLASGSQLSHSSGSPIELKKNCFFTRREKNIISTPTRNSNPGGQGSTLARVGREG